MCQPLKGNWKTFVVSDASDGQESSARDFRLTSGDSITGPVPAIARAFNDKQSEEEDVVKLKRQCFVAVWTDILSGVIRMGVALFVALINGS